MLKHRNLVLRLVLGFEGQVLGLGLGLGTQVLVNNTGHYTNCIVRLSVIIRVQWTDRQSKSSKSNRTLV